MMKPRTSLLVVGLPLLAIIAFFFVMKRWGGIAPQAPVAETSVDVHVPDVPRTARRLPTVLAPINSDSAELPPGVMPGDAPPVSATLSPTPPEAGMPPLRSLPEFPEPTPQAP